MGKRQAALRITAVAVVALACALAGRILWTHRAEFRDAVDDMGLGPVLVSFAFCLVASLANWPVWRGLLASLKASIPAAESARLFFASQIGKYLPGAIWPIVAQTEVGRRYGVPRLTMVGANVTATFVSCTVGLTIAAVALPLSSRGMLADYWWILLLIPALGITIHPRMAPRILNRVMVGLGRSPVAYPPHFRSFLRPAFWSCVVWLALGAHVASLALPLVGGGPDTVTLCVGATALAVSLGLLAIPLPAGIGVRDVVLTALLLTIMSPAQALLVVIASRLMLIAVDLLLALVALAGFKRIGSLRASSSRSERDSGFEAARHDNGDTPGAGASL
jgi:uncharacterized membrane protein YbhN (UPF0104 family)